MSNLSCLSVLDSNEEDAAVSTAFDAVVREISQSRPSIEQLDEKIFPCGGPQVGTLIEISGEPNSGKSLLLWQLMAKCLPPRYYNGKHADVVLVDCGGKFDVRHFTRYVERVIQESARKSSEQELKAVMRSCLNSVMIMECFTPDDLAIALMTVEEDILKKNNNVALLLIDDLDAFYWIDVHKQRMRMTTHYAQLVVKLRRICDNNQICCAYTVDANYIEPKALEGLLDFDILEPNSSMSTTVNVAVATIEYKIRLERLANGKRLLNGQPIYVDEWGIHFGEETVPVAQSEKKEHQAGNST